MPKNDRLDADHIHFGLCLETRDRAVVDWAKRTDMASTLPVWQDVDRMHINGVDPLPSSMKLTMKVTVFSQDRKRPIL
jgi:hypothetical protein